MFLIFYLRDKGFYLSLFIIILYVVLLVLRGWWNRKVDKILEDLQNLSEKEFGKLIKNYFIEKGFKIIKEKDSSLVIEKGKEKIIIGYKNYHSLVGVSQVKLFSQTIDQNTAKGYFITSADFVDLSWTHGDKIELINGRKLIKMLKIKFIKQQLEKGKQYG